MKLNEQLPVATGDTPTETCETPVSVPENSDKGFGKFSSGEELLKAYESLEKEFTKRSQRLKDVEAVLKKESEKTLQTQAVEAFKLKYPEADLDMDEIVSIASGISDDRSYESKLESALIDVMRRDFRSRSSYENDAEFLVNATLNNPEARSRVFNRVIGDVRRPSARLAGKGGETPMITPSRASNLQEASAMAEAYLNNHIE